MSSTNTKTIASGKELDLRKRFFELYAANPIPDEEKLSNVGLFLKRQELTKMVYLNHVYNQILNTHEVIMEFGTRWGQNLVTLSNLRGMYEPYNYSRKIVGFDTFAGFEGVSQKDGGHGVIKKGSFT